MMGPTDRGTALKRTLPLIVVSLLAAAVILLLALRTVRSVNQAQEEVGALTVFAQVCQGRGVAQAAPYAAGAGTRPTVAFRQVGNSWVVDPAAVPGTWATTDPAQTELVLCLETVTPLSVARCTEDASGGRPTRVYGEAIEAHLLTARDAQVVAEAQIDSAPDPGCWRETEEGEAAGTVTPAQLHAWLEAYASPSSP